MRLFNVVVVGILVEYFIFYILFLILVGEMYRVNRYTCDLDNEGVIRELKKVRRKGSGV